jgi:hypothetical protein
VVLTGHVGELEVQVGGSSFSSPEEHRPPEPSPVEPAQLQQWSVVTMRRHENQLNSGEEDRRIRSADGNDEEQIATNIQDGDENKTRSTRRRKKAKQRQGGRFVGRASVGSTPSMVLQTSTSVAGTAERSTSPIRSFRSLSASAVSVVPHVQPPPQAPAQGSLWPTTTATFLQQSNTIRSRSRSTTEEVPKRRPSNEGPGRPDLRSSLIGNSWRQYSEALEQGHSNL